MKNIRILTMFLTSLMMGMVSCSDFLEVEPDSSATTGNAFKTAEDIEAALIGAYEAFYMEEYYFWDFMLLGDVRSDNSYSGGDDPEINEYDNLQISPLNSRVSRNWRDLFNAIARTNLVIDKVEEVSDPKLEKNNRREFIVGEAKFLRAIHYFQLVKIFGGVPLVSEFGSTDSEVINQPRATEEEVYNFIITDLEAALILPDTYGDISLTHSRATKGAVNALLAKVYAQKPSPNYEKVLEYTNAVIQSSAGYQLHSSYDELFDGTHYDNNEAIFQIQFITDSPQSNWAPQQLLPPWITDDEWRKFATPSKDLIAAYDSEADWTRMDANITWGDVDWSDEYWKPCPEEGSIPFVYKWPNADGWSSGDYIYVLRLGDIILLKAEAESRLGNKSEAIALVNQIRQRVNLDEIDLDTDDRDVDEIVLKERRLELAYEGTRWDDLLRFGKLQSTMDALEEYKLSCGNSSEERVNYTISNPAGKLPIPQSAINRNPNLEQNSGY